MPEIGFSIAVTPFSWALCAISGDGYQFIAIGPIGLMVCWRRSER